jgi:hypothetical protein
MDEVAPISGATVGVPTDARGYLFGR